MISQQADGRFRPYDSVTLAVTTTTASVAIPLPTDIQLQQTLLLTNTGTNVLYFRLGGSSITATTNSIALNPDRGMEVYRGTFTHVAAITATGASSLNICSGEGRTNVF